MTSLDRFLVIQLQPRQPSLSPKKGTFVALQDPLLKAKQHELTNVDLIVIDEHARTPREMLGWIDVRCRQFKSCDEFFDGRISLFNLLKKARTVILLHFLSYANNLCENDYADT
jgi:hypothetical protein